MAKRLLALLLVIAMLCSFAACGEDPTTSTNAPSVPTTNPTPTEPTILDPTGDPIDESTNPTEPSDP